MFYLTVHHSLARVQSPTCTTYRKFLLESIMAMLTPKLGIPSYSIARVDQPFNSKRGGVWAYCKNLSPLKLLEIKYLLECINL